MSYQSTIKKDFKLIGKCPASGNLVEVIFSPASVNTGIVYESKRVRASLIEGSVETTKPYQIAQTIVLKNGKRGFANIEHDLPTFFTYGIDNIIIKLNKKQSLTSFFFRPFGHAGKIEFVPYFPNLQKDLCEKIEEIGTIKQNTKRQILKLRENFETENKKLKFEIIPGDELKIRSFTSYFLKNGDKVDGDKEISFVPEQYKEIAVARAFCGAALKPPKDYKTEYTRKTGKIGGAAIYVPQWLIGCLGYFLYLSHGFGKGCSDNELFYPPTSAKEWRQKERIKDEIAGHTNIDRAGDFIAAIQVAFNAKPAGIRPEGIRITSRFASHKDVISSLVKYHNKFYIENP